jgi:hypothetical protein
MSLPSFSLRKVAVMVEVVEWVGDLDHFSELKEVWVQLEGIPPKWCDCKIFAHMISGFGLLTDVDWASLFKSFYEKKIRVMIACHNPSEIPMERLFELDKKLYLITISVEGVEQVRNNRFKKGDDDDDQDDEDAQDDDCDDLLDDEQEIETDKTIDSAAKSGGSRGRQLTGSNVKSVSCGQAENQVEEAAPNQLQ